MKPVLVIPTRYDSTRLPAKALRLLKGKPLVQHVYERALQAQAAFETIVIATDDQRIQAVCEGFGATVCMTATTHETGSDRLAEVVEVYGWADDRVVVNLQGDEPLTPVENLYQLANNLQAHPEAMIATLATPVQSKQELADPNSVKVVKDLHGLALYFSRAQIPFQRDAVQAGSEQPAHYALRHIGMYAYRAEFLKAFARLAPCPLEQLEKLEQLRALYYGYRIHVDLAQAIPGPGVDTEADLQLVESLM
ncbi:3-deoxy-manno-octulosonate cytidylyltransferase (CMP-KDO synthetase) [Thiothrix eikelboomii]|uniref:3-deoxy-manno-octulosonate cytidylyltransferase n=1 Tax=Thiothrix eikelboomii TaxID=92487 RepID=A0A1T4XNS0_9GAMM|nr:3-deoxy-manno-octulosonate cytidylyltransferase [Thiothrix eikelboomii]SKA91186.1 3-deoxy-manno-octulosonate cytidylyltransferase (CMP-KDO synthetase) [Thiothrix eikelboomii]